MDKLENELKLKPLRLAKRVSFGQNSPYRNYKKDKRSLSEHGEPLGDDEAVKEDVVAYGTNDKKYQPIEKINVKKKFNLGSEDIFFDSWNCAMDIKKTVPIQGVLYVFSTKFGFYSPFNKKN